MANADPKPEGVTDSTFTQVELAYTGASQLLAGEADAQLSLFGNVKRSPVQFEASLHDPLCFREALAVLHGIVASDFRYQPKDRTQYAAYLRMKKELSSLTAWQAQRRYFDWLVQHDPSGLSVLDPVITVHPDEVFFEVFSKDEGAYAKLSFSREAFRTESAVTLGTTNIDFSPALFTGIQQLRSYRNTKLSISSGQTSLATTGTPEILQKKVNVPDSWLRGFLQVQSSATLPMDRVQLQPIDLYNVMRYLRMHGDRKGQKRGLRLELVPNQPVRLVLEPWEWVLPSSAHVYSGKAGKVVRVWGRRRLMLLKRLLPYLHSIDGYLLGSGLPSFWVLRGQHFHLTLGLTGFTSANWAQALSFDLLLPRQAQPSAPVEKVVGHLSQVYRASRAELSQATGLAGADLYAALQWGCQQGTLLYDLANDVYRYRPLSEKPIELTRLQYRNLRERQAHDLLGRAGSAELVNENRLPGVGLELTGKIRVAEEKREYRPKLVLADEGQVTKAECTCALFRQQGLKAGPCAHLLALRLLYAEEERQRQAGLAPAEQLLSETRSFSKRDKLGENVVQLTLEKQRLKMRWGRAGTASRLQTLCFNSVDEARQAYFGRQKELHARGYLEATAG